jgi:hypothetical protein
VSFEAYLDNIEQQTGKTPAELVDLARAKGFDDPTTKAGAILDWLQAEHGLGRGHGMALVRVIKNGPEAGVRMDGLAKREKLTT